MQGRPFHETVFWSCAILEMQHSELPTTNWGSTRQLVFRCSASTDKSPVDYLFVVSRNSHFRWDRHQQKHSGGMESHASRGMCWRPEVGWSATKNRRTWTHRGNRWEYVLKAQEQHRSHHSSAMDIWWNLQRNAWMLCGCCSGSFRANANGWNREVRWARIHYILRQLESVSHRRIKRIWIWTLESQSQVLHSFDFSLFVLCTVTTLSIQKLECTHNTSKECGDLQNGEINDIVVLHDITWNRISSNLCGGNGYCLSMLIRSPQFFNPFVAIILHWSENSNDVCCQLGSTPYPSKQNRALCTCSDQTTCIMHGFV